MSTKVWCGEKGEGHDYNKSPLHTLIAPCLCDSPPVLLTPVVRYVFMWATGGLLAMKKGSVEDEFLVQVRDLTTILIG